MSVNSHFTLSPYALVAGCLLFILAGCSSKSNTSDATNSTRVSPPPATKQTANRRSEIRTPSPIALTDVSGSMGIAHVFDQGATGMSLLVETSGGGVGWCDFDRDGWPDVLFNQGGNPLENAAPRQLEGLFRNLDGQRFENVSMSAKLLEREYSQGVAVGDFDNDGFPDIYITAAGPNSLWKNQGDGTFTRMSVPQLADNQWSISAAWADLDHDGDLDLYVTNYCKIDLADPKPCTNNDGEPTICNPGKLEPVPDACFINQGNGSFENLASELGLSGPDNRAMGVVIGDFTNDGSTEVYVANDTTKNFFFVANDSSSYSDEAELLGCATDRLGATQASMGLAVNDFNRNGYQDILVTHYQKESNTLYSNFGKRGFQDVTALTRLHRPTLELLGFGTAMQDFNSDGLLDLIVANGHVAYSSTMKMPISLFQFNGQHWQETRELAALAPKRLGRGLAHADFDRDGDLDVAILNLGDNATLLQSSSEPLLQNNSLNLEFIRTQSNRDGIGVKVRVEAKDEVLHGQLIGGGSFASTHQQLLHFAFSGEHASCKVTVSWPSGIESKYELALGMTHQLLERK